MQPALENEFPVWALLPKRETGVTTFLNKYPDYDGRGIVIAIFDSGVDPGAPGLQVTSDGKHKVIGRFDCSGAGDVDTSKIVEPINGTITGITGRTLTIPSSWRNPSNQYHIGVKNGYELYSKALRERIETERKQKHWDPGFKSAAAESNLKLSEIIKAQESIKTLPSRTDKLSREELESQVDILAQIEKKYCDYGPTYDCIVFHDGSMWRVCIDTSERGDLESCTLLGEYDKTYEFAPLTKADMLNYSVNVYDDGNCLEIVSLASSHGTHVASITAAYFPDQPEKNGVAPGAQLVSLSIGDQRLDTMETGKGIVRAMIKVMESQKTENPITVINMSYGEQSSCSTSGRIGELINEVVDKYGVTWVAAAGNHGPALGTIGTPPDISTENIIGVGAYVSPEMMIAEYSLRNKAPGLPYTWSSRGPTIDGGKGVTVCAPGGAITSVPQYLLRNAQLLNGTSMASPHVAGAVALLLSGLKMRQIKHTPYMIQRSLIATAQFMPQADYFAQGHGLLQLDKAFEHLTTYINIPDNLVRFQVGVGAAKSKGILMRSGLQDKPTDYAVTIEPVFADTSNIDLKEKLDFQICLALTCDKPWVYHPAYLELNNMARNINVRVDPTGLLPGVHVTAIKAFDVKQLEKGPLFSIEITVVRPLPLDENSLNLKPIQFNAINIKPGEIRRHFWLVPERASYAVLKLNSVDKDKEGNFLIHAVQLLPKKPVVEIEYHKMSALKPDMETVHSFKVKGGVILELVISKFWSEQIDSNINYSMHFGGCRIPDEKVIMNHANGILRFDVLGGLQVEEVSPSVSLKHNVIPLKPVESKIMPCSMRDVIPPERYIYQLMLTYNFHLPKGVEVTPSNGLLSSQLYESEFEAQLWMIFDSNKQLMGAGDAFPDRYSLKLEKGDYVIKHQLRHEKKEILEKYTDLPMLIKQKLPNSINLDLYASSKNAVTNGKKLNTVLINTGPNRVPIYVAPFQGDKSLKNITPGQYLKGTLNITKSDVAKKIDTYSFYYYLTDLSKKNSNSSKTTAEKTKWEEYQDALRDLKTSWLAKMDNSENAEKLYEELKAEFSSHITVHSSMLQSMEPDSKRPYPGKPETDEMLQQARSVLKLSGEVIDMIDQKSLLAYFGIKSDQRVNATTVKTTMDQQKSALIDAISRKGAILSRFYMKNQTGDGEVTINLEAIDELWQTLLKYVEPTEIKSTGYFGLWHAAAHKHYGRFLKMAYKMHEEKASPELEESIIWALEQAGWKFAKQHVSRSTFVRFPASYRLF